MGLRNVPTSIKDPNLAGFLRELRAAIGGVSDQVTKIIATRSTASGGGGGGGPVDPGPGGGGGGGGGGGTVPTQATIVLSISPAAPKSNQEFTLTATVTGNQPTGRVLFRRNSDLMTLDPYTLPSSGVVTHSGFLSKGTYTFVAEYSGDTNNLGATSNVLTVEVGSVWDGPPDPVTSLSAVGYIGYIVVSWVMPFIGDLDVVEVWASESNNRATATKVGESNGSMFIFTPDPAHLSWYFWVRVRDSEGLFSTYFPNTTQGVAGVAFSLEDEIAGTPLWNDLGTRLTDGEAAVEQISGIVEGPNGLAAQYMVKTDVNGLVSGIGLYNDGNVSDFFVRADRFAVGNPARYGVCSIAGHTTQAACKAAGGTWTWDPISQTSIPFIVYTTRQTITSADGQQTLTVEPGVYMKSANIQKAFINDAQFTGYLKSYSWPMTNGVPNEAPGSFPFAGWILDKSVSNPTLKIYGGGFGLWDQYGKPIITSGKIAFDQFRRLILTASAEAFVVGPAPDNAVTPASITLRVRAQNLAGVISMTATSGYTGTFGSITVSENGDADFPINPTNFTAQVATFTTASTIAGVVYNDTLTIAKVQEGSNALVMLMSNESDSLTTASDGSITGTVTVSTNVKVLRGSKNVLYSATAEASPSWSVAVTMDPVGATYAWDSATGILSIPITTSSANVVRATVTATRGAESLAKVMTVTKQKQGVPGTNGTYVSYVFKASTTQPAAPTDTAAVPSGWLDSPPVSTNPVWMSKATVTGSTAGTWSTPVKVTGADGAPGDDGNYTTYQYAVNTSTTTAPSSGWSDTPYSVASGQYQWMKTKTTNPNTGTVTYGAPFRVTGEKGDQGSQGNTGTRGGVYAVLSGTFTALSAWNAILAASNTSTCVPGDYVSDSQGSFYQYDSGTGGSSVWLSSDFRVHGNAVVSGTLSASALKAQEVWSNKITLETGSSGTFGQGNYNPSNYIQSKNFTPGASTGFRIDGAGNAEFNNVKVRGDVLLGGGNLIQNSEGLHGYTDIGTGYDTWNNTTTYPPQFLTGESATGGYFNLLQPSGGYSTNNGYMYAFVMRSGTAMASRIAVQAGKKYQFSVDAMINSEYTRGDLYIDWHTGNTNWVDGVYVDTWTNASAVVSITGVNTIQSLSIIATAPYNATHCVPVLRKYCPSTAQYTSFFFTKMVFAEVPSGQVSPIPWSPGGISLLDTLGLRAKAVSNGAFDSSGGLVTYSSATKTVTVPTSAAGDVHIAFHITVKAPSNAGAGVKFDLWTGGAKKDSQIAAVTVVNGYAACTLSAINTSKAGTVTFDLIQDPFAGASQWSWSYLVTEFKR